MPAQFEGVNSPIVREPVVTNGISYVLDDEIVISGVSGRLPESSTIEEFKENLMNGVDMVSDDERRWPAGLYGLPKRTGKLKDLSSFDATFFGVHAKQAHAMDPQIRLLLEATHEAILDAGYNPVELRGSRTGVFVGISTVETDDYMTRDPDKINGYGLLGCCRAMHSNRISYSFDFKGPSFAVDTACSSSLVAFNNAVSAIKSGDCDAAIVGGVNLCLKPANSLQFFRLNMLSPDGSCKAFDASGDGYVRSEAVVAVFLQKSKVARRIYSTVVHSKTNTDGYKDLGITFPNGDVQNRLMREVYMESGINPADVFYVEAHGTGTKAGDPQEINSIADMFCKDRKSPLLIGSVKSNMGHPEPASGVCAIVKILLAMESGIIPGNLHYKIPNPDIPALLDGRIKVANTHTPLKGNLMAVNSFGFGGANAHVLLRANTKPKLPPSVESRIPKLIAVSGRTNEAVDYMLDRIEEYKTDDEFLALIRDIHVRNIPGHNVRGYQILGSRETREISECNSGQKRPIWFVFSGMGSQWAGMGQQLFCIETFQRSIQRCADALKPEGIDLMDLILNGTQEKFEERVLYSFVTIAAIQVALVDVLTSLDIHPDGILGHSVGELGCAYADGTFTPEQTVLAAYWRGKSIQESVLPPGLMAAVGLSWEETKKLCPPGIFPVCHNSADSVTISGPKEDVTKFIAQLKEQEIFAKLVNSSGIAFHSKYIASAGPKLRAGLEKIIPSPKPRSPRWISSSIPESSWGAPLAQLSSAAYHVNNLLSPVLFQEALTHVPDNAIMIEIAPHCLLQAILRRSLPSTVTNISLHKRDHADNLSYLLSNLGKLYNAGGQPRISKLYPQINYPVGVGTPMINSLIKWDHSMEWYVANFASGTERSRKSVIEVDLSKETDAYIAGHTIDGRVLFPATGYITLVWRTLAKLRMADYEKMPVVFENLRFQRATIMPKEGPIRFLVNILDGTGAFEICENGSIAVSGRVYVPDNIEKEQLNLSPPVVRNDKKLLELTKDDIYKDLRLRGYDYKGLFQGIKSSDNRAVTGKLSWNDDWISYMDCMLQFKILGTNNQQLYVPTSIQRVSINPTLHTQITQDIPEQDGIPIYAYSNINIVKSGGIEIRNMKASLAPRRQQAQTPPKLERYTFIPYDNPQPLVEDPDKAKLHALTVLLQIIIENIGSSKMKIVEAAGERAAEALLAPMLLDILYSEPTTNVDLQIATTTPDSYSSVLSSANLKTIAKDINVTPIGQDLHLTIAADIMTNKSISKLKNLATSLKSGGFALLEETEKINESLLNSTDLILVARQSVPGKTYVLLKKIQETKEPIIIQITEKNFSWLEGMKAALKKIETEKQQVLFVSQGEELLGMVGLMNCVRLEIGGQNTRYVFIQDKNAPKFSLNAKFYSQQLNMQLTANVLKGGQWGCYRHLRLDQQTDVSSLHVEHAYINTLTRGDLSSLRWIEGPLSYYQPEKFPNTEFCSVYYAPLNFRDIMLATGKLPPDALPGDLASQDCILGLEFSGRNSKGKRVMGTLAARGLATTVLADPLFMWEVPDKWTLEEASSIPVVYATSYYALFVRGRLQPGETVLIHAGAGGVGLASIAIALHAGCKVFTTVGSQEKRDFLKKTFPQLTDRHIGNTRDTSFEQLILTETNGRGVDVVLNSLSDDKLQASVRCLAREGRFLEIGKYDLSNDSPLGMSVFLKNTAFHGILLDALFDRDCPEKREVVRLVSEGIKNGAVRPLPTTVFSEQQIEQGFRYMATGKHIGKVVLKIRDEEPQKVTQPTPKTVSAIPRTYMNPDKSYVLVGGLGGFGLELTNWLITRGAKHIVLTSRSGIRTGYQEVCIRRWHEMNINVVVSTADVTTLNGAEKLIKESNKIAPIGGIFNLAVVLRDYLIENLTEADYKTVALPKIDATKNLDILSRKLCPALDYFVCFSSVVCGRGNVGQTSYGFANSAMERIMEQRQANSLPGTAIQWGAIGDVGLLSSMASDAEVGGTLPQRMSSCLATLDIFLQQLHPILCSMVLADKQKTTDSSNLINLSQAVANILGIKDVKTVNMNITLADLGMDSLMGTEIKQTLERSYDLILSPQEIRGLTFAKLQELSAGSTESNDQPIAANNGNAITENGATEMLFQCGSELIPTESLIQLQTKSSNGMPIFLVHAIEGVVSSLKSLAAELERPVWGLQCTQDAPLNSLSELAEFYVKKMKKVQKEGPYHIVGYSFGACVALEMALQLESKGEKTILTLLDGSPAYIRLHSTVIHNQANQDSNDIISDGCRKALAFFVRQFNPSISFLKAYNVLKETENDDEILDKMVELIGNTTPFPPKDLKVAGILFFKKLRAANLYKPQKYSGKVTLIKSKDNYVSLDNDYGLSEICEQNIHIEEIAGNHRSILTGDSVKKISKLLRV